MSKGGSQRREALHWYMLLFLRNRLRKTIAAAIDNKGYPQNTNLFQSGEVRPLL